LKTDTIKNLKGNYYVSSFFWSTFQKVLAAIISFISTPLLLGYYGKASFGILSIATACNGYMQLLDLGMNTGAVKYFSQWRTEGKTDLLKRVAGTNITFYGLISLINIIGLVILALCGESLFSVTHDEFILLRRCLFILAIFNFFSWYATTFNQLLIASMQITFTMKIQSVITILKGLLIAAVFLLDLTLEQYFFMLTLLVSLTAIPYVIKCKKSGLIDSIMPMFNWQDFKPVIIFSLSIFALSLFQMTATQSRPIILSIFAEDGAKVVADFRIIETIPAFIITVCGTFSGIFLPKTSEMVVRNNQDEICKFAYKWTILTTIIANCMCLPFIFGAENVLTAYVGSEYNYLAIWLILWTISILFQVHSTPLNALVLATGKTKMLVYCSATACVISIIINSFLVKYFNVGSAIIGYFIYIVINLTCLYGFYYKRTLNLSSKQVVWSFIQPTLLSIVSFGLAYYLFFILKFETIGNRYYEIYIFAVKTFVWITIYCTLLLLTKTIIVKNKKIQTKYDYNSH